MFSLLMGTLEFAESKGRNAHETGVLTKKALIAYQAIRAVREFLYP